MSISQETIKKVARLARLQLDPQHIPTLEGRLNSILDWIQELEEVQTEGVEPMSSVFLEAMPMRTDVLNDGDCVNAVLSSAPETGLNMFVVPKVVE